MTVLRASEFNVIVQIRAIACIPTQIDIMEENEEGYSDNEMKLESIIFICRPSKDLMNVV